MTKLLLIFARLGNNVASTTVRLSMEPRYLSRLPLRKSTAFVDIIVREGSMDDAKLWQRHVQPHVTDGVDAKWNWPRMLRRYRMSEALMLRKVSLMCIDIPRGDEAVPLARLLLSEGYPALDGSGRRSVYVWYLAAAPEAALAAMSVSYSPNLRLEAIIDTAIQRSVELGYDGRIGLHAHHTGGVGLFCKYRDRARMHALRSAAQLTWARALVGGNDGRYFWSDGVLSKALSRSLDYLR